PSQPYFVLGAMTGGDGESICRLAGHAELAGGELGGDVFAGFAGHGQFEIVDGGGAVQGDGFEHAALNPVDKVRGATGLDDMAAQRRRDGAAVARSPTDVLRDATHIVG